MENIQFNNPFSHVMVPQVTKTVSALTILQMIDNPVNKVVAVQTREIGRVVLWSGNQYDSIGQWTDSDVEARLHELFGQ